ncbi:MAG: PTS sugar transporter subunit IIB [Firmicutes bacterium]|nr:PTS sugar transporter subunit IIB [Bacillota bacterium]
MKSVKILVACGSGVATSMHVAVKLKESMKKAGLKVIVDGCSVSELPYRSGSYDIIVSNAQVPFKLDKPVFNAVPILTGIGEDELIEKIIKTAKETYGNNSGQTAD